jgi:hypothetical protein
MGQVNTKNGTATEEVVKEQAKVIGQQMGVAYFVYKTWYVLCCIKEIVVKMNTV